MGPVKHSTDIFEKNLQKYTACDPEVALLIGNNDYPEYQFCMTHLGELNFYQEFEEENVYYHSMEGAHEEMREWYQSKDFQNNQRIFFYGIGLGYAYRALKGWLKSNPQHRLIFLEDELGVMRRFLETDLATEILKDPQVIIRFLDIYEKPFPMQVMQKAVEPILKGNVYLKSFLGSTRLYTQFKESICVMIRDVIFYLSSWNVVTETEIMRNREVIFSNYYSNMLRQFQAANGHLLKNVFQKVPAIICGAAPSIVEEIETIKALSDKAIIIASGTGMNVLNHYGILPHFGTGLDPSSSQGTRIRTNYAYEVPFFYRPRFQQQSFRLLQGPKLYVQGESSAPVTVWFDEELEVECEYLPHSGVSSTNFSMQIAKMLGCDPIILVGVDLAYTDASRYPSIISAHPTDPQSSKEEISSQAVVPVMGVSNEGKEIVTKIEWFEEAKTMARFAKEPGQVKVINCSKVGLKIQGIDYQPLEEVKKQYLKQSYDLRNLIHHTTQVATPCVKKESGYKKIEEWQESLSACRAHYKTLESELKRLWKECQQGVRLPEAPYSGKIALAETEIQKEPAYHYLLEGVTFLIDDKAQEKKLELRCHFEELTPLQRDLKKLEIDINYVTYFQDHLRLHHALLEVIIKNFEKEETLFKEDHHENQKTAAKAKVDFDSYRLEEGMMVIDDKEMGLSIQAPFNPTLLPDKSDKDPQTSDLFLTKEGKLEGEYLKFTTQGEILARMFYKEGELHGPSTCYNQKGEVTACSWYIEGLREGKSWQYYLSGNLYSLQRYKKGLLEGFQEYYDEEGYLKSLLHYKEGLLDGQVLLYYPSGKIKRELFFQEGKLDGLETYYYPSGQKLWEAHYKEGNPQGFAKVWYEKGQLAREYHYAEDHRQYTLKEWNEKGELIRKEENLLEDLQQIAEKKERELSKAIGSFNKELVQLKALTRDEKRQLIY